MQIDAWIERLEAAREDDAHPGQNAAQGALNWLGWLRLRRVALAEMPEPDRLRRIGLWWERIDRHVWASIETEPELSAEALADVADEDERGELAEALQAEQLAWREWLEQQGIDRIDAEEGASFEQGILEPDGEERVATPSRSLDGLAGRIPPGGGGYRLNGLVQRPSRAPRLAYTP